MLSGIRDCKRCRGVRAGMEGRDFKSEIDAAQNDPVWLRKIADDIHASGGSRILMIRAIQLARAADSGPHPLGKT